jgi:hypothetical protein
MNRASSALATKVLAAASCLGSLGELSTKEASAQIVVGPVQVFFVQHPNGQISQYESTGPSLFLPGQQVVIRDASGVKQGTVIPSLTLSWGVPTPSIPSPAIQVLAPPRIYATPAPSADLPVLPPRSLSNTSGGDSLLISTLRERINYNGPSDIRTEVIDSAINGYIAAARSWLGTTPAMSPVQLKVTILPGRERSFTVPDLISGATVLSRKVEIREPVEGVVGALRHEFCHNALHDALGESVPDWFDEGVACAMQQPDNADRLKQSYVISAKWSNRDISLPDLFRGIHYSSEDDATLADPKRTTGPTKEDVTLFYAKSTALVDYLATHSPGKDLHERRQYVTGFIRTIMAAGCTIEAHSAAFKQFYKISDLSDLDSSLREWASKPSTK